MGRSTLCLILFYKNIKEKSSVIHKRHFIYKAFCGKLSAEYILKEKESMKKFVVPGIIILMIACTLSFIIGYKVNKNDSDTAEEEGVTTVEADLAEGETKAFIQHDYEKYLTLGTYTGLTATRSITKVTDEDILDAIEAELITWESVTRGIQKGDYVTLDFTGTIDGEEFEGGSAEDYEICVGDYDLLEELEDGLLGAKTGDKLSIPVTFPDDYDEEGESGLAGKKAQFAVTVKAVEIEKTEELNAASAKEQGYDSVDAYKKAKKEELEEENYLEAEDNLQAELFTMVSEASKLGEYTDAMYQEYQSVLDEEIADVAEQWGMDEESVKSVFYGITDDDSYKQAVEDKMLENLIFEAIADKEGLIIDESTYLEKALELAQSQELNSVEELETYQTKDEITAYIIKMSVLETIEAKATITEEYVDAEEYEE